MSGATTHDMQIGETLEMAGCLGLLPKRVVFFGIEIASTAPEQGLTPSVAAAANELVRQLRDELVN